MVLDHVNMLYLSNNPFKKRFFHIIQKYFLAKLKMFIGSYPVSPCMLHLNLNRKIPMTKGKKVYRGDYWCCIYREGQVPFNLYASMSQMLYAVKSALLE